MTANGLHTRLWPGVLLCLLALLVASGATVPLGAAQAAPTALIRIDLPTGQSQNELAGLGFPIYAQLYTLEGGTFWLLPATAGLQAELTSRGYTPRVLDSDVSRTTYYLLYGAPQVLEQAESSANVLWVEGRQAVASAKPTQARQLKRMRLHLRALRLRPWLPAPTPQVSAHLAAVTPNPTVQAIINQVSSTTLYNYVGDLSGEWPVTIGGASYTLRTRYSLNGTAIQKATQYAYEHFQALGLPVEYDYYDLEGVQRRNVVAEQTGVGQPGKIILITAHMDSITEDIPEILAPGADDNASGSAAVMVAADILSKYQFNYTLRYVLFTGEEQDLYGSDAYAEQAHNLGENIVGVLNLDMVSYNTTGSASTLDLHTRPSNASDLNIANLFTQVISAYSIDLQPTIRKDGVDYSDHYSFWYYGFPAILAIEDENDETPYYHSDNDTLSTLNMTYFKSFVQASLGAVAHMSNILQGRLHGVVSDSQSGLPLAGANVIAKQGTVQRGSTSTLTNGEYTLYLAPGSYDVKATASSHRAASAPNVIISGAVTTTLNLSLKPCAAVQALDFVFTPYMPAPGQTITFTATAVTEIPLTYEWNFDDGGSVNGQVVTHSFATNGWHSALLTIGNACTTTWRQKFVPVPPVSLYLPIVLNPAP